MAFRTGAVACLSEQHPLRRRRRLHLAIAHCPFGGLQPRGRDGIGLKLLPEPRLDLDLEAPRRLIGPSPANSFSELEPTDA